MKILAIGDLHGRIPNLRSLAGKEKPDIIICTGDFADDEKIRELIFRNWGKPWWQNIGKKRARQLVRESDKKGKKALEYLSKLNIPVYYIPGNSEGKYSYGKRILKNKSLHYSHLRKFRISGHYFIFHGGYIEPRIFFSTKILGERKKAAYLRRKRHDKEKKKIMRLFERTEKTVFVTHFTPYKLFDAVKNKKSPMNNKHVGVQAYSDIIKKYKPELYICGHMHENQGIAKIGRTRAICLGMGDKNVFLIKLDGKIAIRKRKL